MWGISWLAEEVLTSQEGLCCMGLDDISITGRSWNLNFLRSEIHKTQTQSINGRRHSASSNVWGCLQSLDFEKRESGRNIACRKAVFSDLPESNSRHLGQEPRHYDLYTLAVTVQPARNISGELKCALASFNLHDDTIRGTLYGSTIPYTSDVPHSSDGRKAIERYTGTWIRHKQQTRFLNCVYFEVIWIWI